MSVPWLSHSLAAVAMFMAVGAALTALPASGGSPISHSPIAVPSPISGPASGALVANATCTASVALVALPSTVPVGQLLTLQTQVFFHKSAPSAVCAAPLGFLYTNVPIGCVTVSMPQMSCTVRGVGIFTPTVHVFFPAMTLSVPTTVTVFSP
ncbi:MAG: hypothetical protein L3J87_00200 [Thermoplasmata archaeon]|nr:hypothetical protein [Thermoplasmata archaeon]MCI4344036.1 hypothetical protein [Thermoplasmata archaeon]